MIVTEVLNRIVQVFLWANGVGLAAVAVLAGGG
jgi:hypothetical protein